MPAKKVIATMSAVKPAGELPLARRWTIAYRAYTEAAAEAHAPNNHAARSGVNENAKMPSKARRKSFMTEIASPPARACRSIGIPVCAKPTQVRKPRMYRLRSGS